MKNFTDYLLKNNRDNKKKIFINGQIKYSELKKKILYINMKIINGMY